MTADTRLGLGVAIEKAVLDKNGTREDIAFILKERGDVFDACADPIVGAARETKGQLEFTVIVNEDETFDGLLLQASTTGSGTISRVSVSWCGSLNPAPTSLSFCTSIPTSQAKT